MLPLLPALLLLLLQGPSNFERLSVDGRLPAALEAFHRELAQPNKPQLSEQDENALASLLAAGIDVQLSQAFLALFQRSEIQPSRPAAFQEEPASIDSKDTLGNLQEGFSQCRRTRDGPAHGASSN